MGEPTFICDAMLGGLARWLRAAGYWSCFDSQIRDAALVRRAFEEGHCLLTSDSGVMKHHAVAEGLVESVFVPIGLSPVEQLGHVLHQRGLALRQPRCMDCGGRLVRVPLQQVEESVPPKVQQACKRFYQCGDCGKVYWRGTHWQDIRRKLRIAASYDAESGHAQERRG